MATHSEKKRKRKGFSSLKMFRSHGTIIIAIIRSIFDWIVDTIFGFIYNDTQKKQLPPLDEPFLMTSAVSIADKIRKKQLSSEKVVISFIERIKQVNPFLNCVVDECFEKAIQDAKEVDNFLNTTTLSYEGLKTNKPFLGVPFTSKESTASKGMKFTFGMISRKNMVATEDAEIVKAMKNAGGILVGVTNIPELNLWSETRNLVYGQTNNPYDFNRTTGGSSGGEAAALAASATPLSLGTDIGGSIRMPAFFCGVFGHKTTAGLISTKGLTFRTGTEKQTMVCSGPMTRYAEDLLPSLKVLVPEHNLYRLKLDEEVNIKDLNFFYVEDPGDLRISPISEEIKKGIRSTVKHLEEITGKPAEKISLSGFKHSFTLWRYWMTKEPSRFAWDLGNQKSEVSLISEIPKFLTGRCNFTLPSLMQLVQLKVLPPVPSRWAENETNKLRNELTQLLGNNGVLIFPSHPTPTHYHYTPFFRPYNFGYWAILNTLHLPVTQVPLGLSDKGLPIGVQVAAGLYNDRLCLAVAKELEQAFGGYVPPFSILSSD
uniref:Amidase domain-containing protein n=2 Tax=Clastoptera arizonana TaxID=38151 RepID=A0A1B6C263_9HEMI